MSNNMITVVYGQDEYEKDDVGNIGFSARQASPRELEIDEKRLRDELSKIAKIVGNIEDNDDGQFSMSEIELNLTITTSGKLALLGTGVEAGAKASIKVKYVKNPKL